MPKLTGTQRAAHECAALRVDQRLETAARGHADDVAGKHDVDRDNSLSPSGAIPAGRPETVSCGSGAGEDIAVGDTTAAAVRTAGLNSSGHRAFLPGCHQPSGAELDSNSMAAGQGARCLGASVRSGLITMGRS